VQADSQALWMTNMALSGNNGRLQAISLNRSWLLLAGVPCSHHIADTFFCIC
jgi:hypothetical protein